MSGWVGYITNQSVINMQTTTFSNDAPSVHKRERRKEARPGELLDAALSLFVNKGFSATKVEDVAASAGVSKGTLFLYFSSKEDLFKAVIRANLVDHFPAWNQEFEEFQGSTRHAGVRHGVLVATHRLDRRQWHHQIGHERGAQFSGGC